MANDDRVADLYYRRIQSTESQNACRDRIHWLCAHVEGPRVLDVGCSQGVVPIILGREGCTVVGLDIEAEAIAAARQALAEESRPVQERVTFRVEDAFSAEFSPGSFDTVIFGEVLEHLSGPERLLERACGWLRPGGRVVVSVPHGYEPFHDHKRTFYLLGLIELLGRHFSLLTVEPVHDKYLCAVALRPADGQLPTPPSPETVLRWLRECEPALEALQRRAHREKEELQADRKKLSERGAAYRESITKLTKTAEELRAELRSSRAALAQEQAARARLAEELTEVRRQVAEELAEVRRQLAEAARQQSALARELEAARQAEKRAQVELQQQREAAKKAQALADSERRRRQQVEAQIERLRNQVEYYKAELDLRLKEVRYRLGDAFVRAARPSLDTLKLPFRFVHLFFVGLGRVRQRRREARQRRAATTPQAAAALSTAAAPAPPAPATRAASAATGGKGATAAAGAPPAPATCAASAATAAVAPGRQTGQLCGPPACSEAENRSGLDLIPALAEPYSATPPELLRRRDLCVATVADEFSWRAWQYEAELYTFTPQTWREALEARRPDLLLVESAWSGLRDSWYFQIRDLGQRGDVIKYYALPDIIAWCRARGVPTVFYNKEDPPNFDVFIEAAKQFDCVFTSDANCIPDYRKYVGHERVFALPFAAQPRIHNPVMTGTRSGAVCFAGTWYNHRHLARHEDAHKVLRPALDFDLHIFDRMAGSGNPNYRWPDEYLPALRGALPYAQMLAAYKRYKVFLNINSVKNSPTMFARRVFELLACGTPVISSYSEGIEQLLGSDVVLISDDEQTTRQLLERLLGDDEYRERLSLRGQRKVFGQHTYTHRLQRVLEAVGITRPAPGLPAMTLIAAATDRAGLVAALETYRQQTYANKRLLVCATPQVAGSADGVIGATAGVRLVRWEGSAWGRLLPDVLRDCEDGYVVALNPADCYGPEYLTDYANATLYVTEPALGKATYYQARAAAAPQVVKRGNEYRAVSSVHPWTLCLPRARAIEIARRLCGAQSPHEWWNRAMRSLDRIYSADRFNYVQRSGVTAQASQAAGAGLRLPPPAPRELAAALV